MKGISTKFIEKTTFWVFIYVLLLYGIWLHIFTKSIDLETNLLGFIILFLPAMVISVVNIVQSLLDSPKSYSVIIMNMFSIVLLVIFIGSGPQTVLDRYSHDRIIDHYEVGENNISTHYGSSSDDDIYSYFEEMGYKNYYFGVSIAGINADGSKILILYNNSSLLAVRSSVSFKLSEDYDIEGEIDISKIIGNSGLE